VGYGATLRNFNGKILCLVVGYLGETTNNATELTGLLQGLQVAMDKNCHKLILEGDSQIVIQLITKILHGESLMKISPRWQLSGMLEIFRALLRTNVSIIPSHVKREENRVADCMANEGVTTERERIYWEAHTSESSDISDRCQALSNKDFLSPDGVPCREYGPHSGDELGRALNTGHPLPSPHH
jgi:ribonuclease HI